MGIYELLIFILIVLTVVSIRPANSKLPYIMACFIIILFAALRRNGFDWESYENIYVYIKTGHETEGETFVEYGFELLCWLSPSYKFLIFIIAVLSLTLTFKGTYHFSKYYYPVLGLVVFSTTLLLPTYMGQIRQGLAMGIVTLAVWQNYIKQKNIAFLLLICACFFHISAILAFLIFLIPKRDFKIATYIAVILISLMLYGISLQVTAQLLSLSQFGIVQKLIYYAMTENEELGISFTIVVRIVTLLIAVFLNSNRSPEISYITKVYLCGIIVYLIFGFIPQVGGRGSIYFSVYEMVLVPYIIHYFRRRKFICLVSLCLVICLSVFRIISFFADSHNYVSYIPYLRY